MHLKFWLCVWDSEVSVRQRFPDIWDKVNIQWGLGGHSVGPPLPIHVRGMWSLRKSVTFKLKWRDPSPFWKKNVSPKSCSRYGINTNYWSATFPYCDFSIFSGHSHPHSCMHTHTKKKRKEKKTSLQILQCPKQVTTLPHQQNQAGVLYCSPTHVFAH